MKRREREVRMELGGQLKSDQHWLGCQSLQVRRGEEVAT